MSVSSAQAIYHWLFFLWGHTALPYSEHFFSIISVNTRTREVMLPLLLLPVMVPVILASVQALNVYVLGLDVAESYKWLKLLAVFDIIFTVVVFFAVFDFLVED